MILRDGYDRRKHPRLMEFRLMTRAEALDMEAGIVVHIALGDGTARNIRCSGRVRTWKRDPNRIEIPMKYGFRESLLFVWRDGAMRQWGHNRPLLMHVRDLGDPIPMSELNLKQTESR